MQISNDQNPIVSSQLKRLTQAKIKESPIVQACIILVDRTLIMKTNVATN
tara:strand:+ start:854 stop:1003 length:150 start_codon:yes stop_codon:yes gene_type:complete